MRNCIVVIPVYKETLDCVEEISLKRLYTVLKDSTQDVCLIYPDGMNTKAYTDIYPNLSLKTFDPKYFKNTQMYSQLCLSYDFYDYFSRDYKYMLIYQLDCYIFYNAIDEWCEKGYDYVGGPILSTDCGWDTVKKSREGQKWQPYVGNGGLSLRNLETFKEITDPNGALRKSLGLTDEKLSGVRFEDKYFCNDLYDYYELSIPNWIDAMNFALDMSVDIIYNHLNLNPKPMGIHSVDKNIRFWKHVIPEFKEQKVIDYCEEKHKEFFKLYYDENDSTLRTA